MKVTGARQTAANLREMARYVSVQLGEASRFALQPTLTAARNNVYRLYPVLKEETGTLAGSLTIKKMAKSSKRNPVYQVGPDAGFARQTRFGLRKPVKYAHLVEFGTAGGGLRPGHPGTAPHPFMAPAYYSTRDEVVRRFGRKIGQPLEQHAAKLGRTVR